MNYFDLKLNGKKVLVTGGTGFIGGRLVEKLILDCHAKVRVLVRNFANVVRIARFPIEMIHGDLTNQTDVEKATDGCDIVINCAYGNKGNKKAQRLVNIEGTQNMFNASLKACVKRVIHLSTLTVYGFTRDGDLNENAPRRYSGQVYPDSKIDAEKIAFDYHKKHSLPVVIIQPTAVYGPYAPMWTVRIINQLKTGRAILIDGGTGFRNCVYIDDLIDAILLASVKDSAVGEAFLISGEQPVTWKEFYNRYERMLGFSGTVDMSATEAKTYSRKQKKAKRILGETLRLVRDEQIVRQRLLQTYEMMKLRTLLPEKIMNSLRSRIISNSKVANPNVISKIIKPIHPLSPFEIKFNATKTRVCIDKAKRMLGYQPAFDFDAGMKITEQWAEWANLLN